MGIWKYYAVYDYNYWVCYRLLRKLESVSNNFAKPKRLTSTDRKQKIKRASRRESDEVFEEKDYGHLPVEDFTAGIGWGRKEKEDWEISHNHNQLHYKPSPRNVAKARWSKGFDLFIEKEERYWNKPNHRVHRPDEVNHTHTNGELWTRSAHQRRYDKFSWCTTPEAGLKALWEDCQWPTFKHYAAKASRRQGKRETQIQLNEFYERETQEELDFEESEYIIEMFETMVPSGDCVTSCEPIDAWGLVYNCRCDITSDGKLHMMCKHCEDYINKNYPISSL